MVIAGADSTQVSRGSAPSQAVIRVATSVAAQLVEGQARGRIPVPLPQRNGVDLTSVDAQSASRATEGIDFISRVVSRRGRNRDHLVRADSHTGVARLASGLVDNRTCRREPRALPLRQLHGDRGIGTVLDDGWQNRQLA